MRSLLFGVFFFLLAAVSHGQQSRPNIILFVCDDLRSDVLGCMGDLFAQTPHIDKLANEGVTFDNAFATTANCVASRANILTGQYTAKTGWRDGEFRDKSLTPEQLGMTYLTHLRNADYRIGYAGKWDVGRPPLGFFDDDFAYEGQGQYYEKSLEGDTPEHLTSRTAEQVQVMIEKPDPRPFFLCVGFKAPQAQESNKPPFYPHDEALTGKLYTDVEFTPASLSEPEFFHRQPVFLQRSMNREVWQSRMSSEKLYQDSVRGYYRLVAGVDDAVGRAIRTLELQNKADNTVIIFTSDHGVYLGARGFAGKWLPHEPSMRIPLIVYRPQLPGQAIGSRRSEIALTIDLAPTILELAGIEPPSEMQGQSLLPLVNGDEVKDWRSEFFYEHHFMPTEIPACEAVRTERWKYIRYLDSDPLYEELYDLVEDPFESENLIGNPDYDFVHEDMEQAWKEWRVRATGKEVPRE